MNEYEPIFPTRLKPIVNCYRRGPAKARPSVTITALDQASSKPPEFPIPNSLAEVLRRSPVFFSREEIKDVRLIDWREVIGNVSRLLMDTVGKSISVEISMPPNLPLVVGNALVIENVVMNLARNACDAMPCGGLLSIRLNPILVDAAHVKTHSEARVGNFVRLRVSDTGVGMDEKTLAHIFEPFFSTKEAGKATGLGLAVVYGVVKQYFGWVEVTSSPGQGATFDVYFPTGEREAISNEEPQISQRPLQQS